MSTYAAKHDALTRQIARSEGIALTPDGKALFARDAQRLAEIRARDTRSASERAEDEAARAELERLANEQDARR